MIISSRMVFKSFCNRLSFFAHGTSSKITSNIKHNRRTNNKMIAKFYSQMRIIRWTHNFMNFFTRTNTNYFCWLVWRDRLSNISNFCRRQLRNKNFTAMHTLKIFQYKINSLLKQKNTNETNAPRSYSFKQVRRKIAQVKTILNEKIKRNV